MESQDFSTYVRLFPVFSGVEGPYVVHWKVPDCFPAICEPIEPVIAGADPECSAFVLVQCRDDLVLHVELVVSVWLEFVTLLVPVHGSDVFRSNPYTSGRVFEQ